MCKRWLTFNPTWLDMSLADVVTVHALAYDFGYHKCSRRLTLQLLALKQKLCVTQFCHFYLASVYEQ